MHQLVQKQITGRKSFEIRGEYLTVIQSNWFLKPEEKDIRLSRIKPEPTIKPVTYTLGCLMALLFLFAFVILFFRTFGGAIIAFAMNLVWLLLILVPVIFVRLYPKILAEKYLDFDSSIGRLRIYRNRYNAEEVDAFVEALQRAINKANEF